MDQQRRQSQKQKALTLLAANQGLVTKNPTTKQQALAAIRVPIQPQSVGLGRSRRNRRKTKKNKKTNRKI